MRLVRHLLLLALWPLSAAAGAPSADDPQDPLASAEVRETALWIVESRDNGRMPYLIVDKVHARVFVFDRAGVLLGAAPALLGMTAGDRSPAGIGNKPLSAIRPEDRITPAGRYVASLSRGQQGEELLVIDYAAALTLHPVVKGEPAERRAQRLASPSTSDNRISYGCINVPVAFYNSLVSTAFARSSGLVYILPEHGNAEAFFRQAN